MAPSAAQTILSANSSTRIQSSGFVAQRSAGDLRAGAAAVGARWAPLSLLVWAALTGYGCATTTQGVMPGGPAMSAPGASNFDESPRRSPLAVGERAALAAVDDDASLDSDHGGDDLPYYRGNPLTISERMTQRCRTHRGVIERAAMRHGLDPVLLLALAWVESGFNPAVESPAGAVGILQMMPSTANALGCRDAVDPGCEAGAAAAYVVRLLARYQGDLVYALCAYNAGPVGPTKSLRKGELPANIGFATRVLEARSRLERFGCEGR